MLGFVLLSGLNTYLTIPKEATPDVQIPIVAVNVRLEGISPEDAERLLIRPMEQEFKSIEGIKEMKSFAYESGCDVIMEFQAGFNLEKAKIDIRDKLDTAKAEFPDRADEPKIKEVNLSLFPVLVIKTSSLLHITDFGASLMKYFFSDFSLKNSFVI